MKKIISTELNPKRDWRVIVLVFGLGLILFSFLAWKVYLSNQIGGGYLTPDNVSTETAAQTIDKKRLQTDISILETRQSDFLKKENQQPKTIDPSL